MDNTVFTDVKQFGENSVLAKEIENMRVDIGTLRDKIDQVLQRQEDLFKMLSKNHEAKVASQRLRLSKLKYGRFPLKTEEELKQLDDDLATEKREDIVDEMKTIIFGNIKNIENCMHEDIITSFNYDGRKGKKALKNYCHFVDALHEAADDGDKTYEDFVEDLKVVFRMIKNRCNKYKSRMKLKKKFDADASDDDTDDPLSNYSKCKKLYGVSRKTAKRFKNETNEHPQLRTEKRRRCVNCSEDGVDNRTNILCVICRVYLCRIAGRDCFTEYHQQLDNQT